MQALEFAVLGPLEVRRAGSPVPAGGPREHAVLAMLLLADGNVVTVDRLVEAAWEDLARPGTVKLLRNCVSGLRRGLAAAGGPAAPIETTATGYRLRPKDYRLDAREFRQQAAAARRQAAAGRAAQAAAGLRAALRLWRGPALAGIEARMVQVGAVRLDEQRIAALEDLLDLELALARHRQAVSELQALAWEFPLRERITAQLMLALYRSGCQAEALGAYQRLVSRLAGELGIDPTREVTRLHEAILRQDPALDLVQPARRSPRGRPCPSGPHARPGPGSTRVRGGRR